MRRSLPASKPRSASPVGHCFLGNCGESVARQAKFLETLREYKVEGVLLMPAIGTVDITVGLVVGLIRPARLILLYMATWGLLTATIRPLAGEPLWEFVERVPNWAIPLVFLLIRGFGRTSAAAIRART